MFNLFNDVVRFSVFAGLMILLHTEVHAFMKAVLYGLNLKRGTLGQKAVITMYRYLWASVMWHELYADGLEIKPAYSVMRPACLTLGIIAVFGGFEVYGMTVLPGQVYAPGAFVAGISYFISAYGKAFVRYRKDVSIGGTQETWKFA